jgi:hypothetical protein
MNPLLVRVVILLIGAAAASSAQDRIKQDVLVMKNGDTLTGEIKKLENGFVSFKAAYMADTVQIDWKLVDRLQSKDQFTVILTGGGRETGFIEKKAEPNTSDDDFVVKSGDSSTPARTTDIVEIVPMNEGFWRQLRGSVSYGFSFTSGTNSTQSNLAGDVTYQSERWAVKFDGSSVFSRQSGADSSGRNTVNGYYYNYRGERWFVAGTVGFLSSKQQDLTGRETFGTGLGLDLIRRSTSSLQLVGGALFRNEQYAESVGAKSGRGADGQLLLQYTKYRFTKFQFTTQFAAFPSVSQPGRVRMSLQSYFKRELFRNFNVIFSLYENFDSRPPVLAQKNDFGTSTSIGWTFP